MLAAAVTEWFPSTSDTPGYKPDVMREISYVTISGFKPESKCIVETKKGAVFLQYKMAAMYVS